jgi:hypothetical protein
MWIKGGNNILRFLAKSERFRKLSVITTSTKIFFDGLLYSIYSFVYIRDAGRLSHRDQYLSLSTAFRLFFCLSPEVFLTSKDNDK